MPAPLKSDASVGTTDERQPLRLSDALIASAAREAKVALDNGWVEAEHEHEDRLDRLTGEGRR